MSFSSVGREDLLAEVERLLASLDEGRMSATAYETAWMARVPNAAMPVMPRFPLAFDWLLANQHADGSWGGAIPFAHDRLISTLGALLALANRGYRQELAEPAVRRAVVYLNRSLPALEADPAETIGFELILPELARQARNLDLRLPYESWAFVDAINADKLRRIPPVAVYGGPTSLTHSLEYLGERVIPALVRRCQSANGSYGMSPSATVYGHLIHQDDASSRYLDRVAAVFGSGGAPYAHPFEMFETGWVLHELGSIGRGSEAHEQALQRLLKGWVATGAAWTTENVLTDADDTAVIAASLIDDGQDVDVDVLALYEGPEHFITFPFERNTSVTTNAHVLATLRRVPATPDRRRMILKATHYLNRAREDEGYWIDKWHASPFYATAQSVAALAGLAQETVRTAIQWVLDQQAENGAWGQGEGTVEETAWAMQALLAAGAADPALSDIVQAPLERGVSYLESGLNEIDYPPLWIGKTLYAPFRIVRAIILSVLIRAETMRSGRSS